MTSSSGIALVELLNRAKKTRVALLVFAQTGSECLATELGFEGHMKRAEAMPRRRSFGTRIDI